MKFTLASGFSAITVLCFLAGTNKVHASDNNCGTNVKSHNFSYGKRVPADRLFYVDNLDYKSKWMRTISVDVSYPSSGTIQQGYDPFNDKSSSSVLPYRLCSPLSTEELSNDDALTSKGVITYIEVNDTRSDGTGGCVYIKNGGVGQNHVTLHLKSQKNHGMEFVVKVYGQ